MPGTFVLVHGVNHGGWCWEGVKKVLETKGHKVFAPSMLGCSDRAHLCAAKQCTLEAVVADVVSQIESKDLQDIVLVGHSWGGCVIGAVAAHLRSRIARLVFVDAIILESGESFRQHIPPAAWRELAAAAEETDCLPVPPLATFVPSWAPRRWRWHLEQRLRPHPGKPVTRAA